MKQWTIFDLEFTELVEKPLQLEIHIACASVFSNTQAYPQLWFEEKDALYMSCATLEAFIDHLALLAQTSTLVTWGGSASDWRLLNRECPSRKDLIHKLALESIDIPLCAFMNIGTMMGLNAASMAIGLNLKETNDSKLVPELWRTIEERHKVLQHVSNDSYATMQVFLRALETGCLPWITKRQQLQTWTDVQFCTVQECLQKELPVVPWPIGPDHNAKLMARWLIVDSS